MNAGEVAYLYNHYTVDPTTGASIVLSQVDAVALTMAIRELEFDPQTAPYTAAEFTDPTRNFAVDELLSPNPSGTPSLSAFVNQAVIYANAAIGQNDAALFLDPGTVIVGGAQGMMATGSYNFANVRVTTSGTATALTTTPNQINVTPGATSVTLTDTATLSHGLNPTGSITFTLYYDGGSTPVDTEIVPVINGNNNYTTPTGYTLPDAAAIGTNYQWDAVYSGDPYNSSSSDIGDPAELVTVKASPTLITTASFTAGAVVPAAPFRRTRRCSPAATMSGGLNLHVTAANNTVVDTQTITPIGDGSYSTSNVNVATQVGTYTWTVSYAGDGFNKGDSDQGGAAEQVTTVPANPGITTLASETNSGVVGSAV